MTGPALRRRLPRLAGGAARRSRPPYALVLVLLTAALLVSMTVGLGLGSVRVPAGEVWGVLGHRAGLPWPSEVTWTRTRETIVFDVRAPRVLLGAVTGAGLAVVGTAMQALVRNPLADPYLLGISSGASFGAVLTIVSGFALFGTRPSLSLAAFAGALAALSLVYVTARVGGRITSVHLVLAGVAVASVFSALTSFLLLTADRENESREVLSWTLGGLGGVHWETLWLPAAVLTAATVALFLQGRSLNLLLAGEEAAATMGLDVRGFRVRMFVLLSVVTGVLVAATGPIGFVGLMTPHAARLVVGGDHRRLIPAAALGGAAFLVCADVAARTVTAPQEIPVGVLTALCGGPFFLWLMRRQARRREAHAA
ncbi:iron complex transport system permease protein [Streptosporangium becharense]|uniref:Iron complex transport system permease protein n=1 Tax=Streptosporangium becharense TaxID=1816182 RepID=A0A7W9IAS4_9ACTN|nr:iron ABC transporter permease [Streptosporangium becharense]MBB2915356.1 iron complex transport system permease protein [Streptosporangium becharense]MBB5816946.1 iron complex transport system permease protein [Streptosporangium becharense]